MSIQNNRGFSLAELVVGSGIMGILAVGFLHLTRNQGKTIKTQSTNAEITSILGEMRFILANPDNCNNILSNDNIDPADSENVIDSLTQKRGSSAVFTDRFLTKSADPSKSYGQGGVKILDYSLSDADSTVNIADQTTHLSPESSYLASQRWPFSYIRP
jgi:prepilin-type N-terminal cleavage/methylation domain-containing protein